MKNFILPLLCASFLTACATVTAGVTPGDERNFARSLNDINAGRVIEARMKRAYDYNLKGIDVEVAEGVVLLSGNVPTKEARIEAARIAWSAPRIDQVGNEIMIKDKQGFIRNTKDGLLEKAVRARLTADRSVKARNFNIETHDGIVYMMGVARTSQELERAAQIAAQTRGTVEVISYARVADLPQTATLAENQVATQRKLPDFLTTTPPASQQPSAPIQSAPLDQPIPFDRGAQAARPDYEDLGAYRTGEAGEAVSVRESEPYYIDPETGQEIPVSYIQGPR